MIKIATAECFTHGKIGREIHALAQGYEREFGPQYILDSRKYGDFKLQDLSLNCSLFIPTMDAVKKILKIKNPPQPECLIKGIKVYDEKQDMKVSQLMAESVKKQTGCDISIGTTAGVGRGGISLISDEFKIITTSDVEADLKENNSRKLYLRQESGIQKALEILLWGLNGNLDQISQLDNIEIDYL